MPAAASATASATVSKGEDGGGSGRGGGGVLSNSARRRRRSGRWSASQPPARATLWPGAASSPSRARVVLRASPARCQEPATSASSASMTCMRSGSPPTKPPGGSRSGTGGRRGRGAGTRAGSPWAVTRCSTWRKARVKAWPTSVYRSTRPAGSRGARRPSSAPSPKRRNARSSASPCSSARRATVRSARAASSGVGIGEPPPVGGHAERRKTTRLLSGDIPVFYGIAGFSGQPQRSMIHLSRAKLASGQDHTKATPRMNDQGNARQMNMWQYLREYGIPAAIGAVAATITQLVITGLYDALPPQLSWAIIGGGAILAILLSHIAAIRAFISNHQKLLLGILVTLAGFSTSLAVAPALRGRPPCPAPTELRLVTAPENVPELRARAAQYAAANRIDGCPSLRMTVAAAPPPVHLQDAFANGGERLEDRRGQPYARLYDLQPDAWVATSSAAPAELREGGLRTLGRGGEDPLVGQDQLVLA